MRRVIGLKRPGETLHRAHANWRNPWRVPRLTRGRHLAFSGPPSAWPAAASAQACCRCLTYVLGVVAVLTALITGGFLLSRVFSG